MAKKRFMFFMTLCLFVSKKGFLKTRFNWQSGYGAFSYSKSHVPRVVRYIQNQEEHHRKQTFLGEYVELLKEAGIEYDKRYIFEPLV